MTTSDRVQRFNGIPVDVAELMMVLWMASIVVLKYFSMPLDFCSFGLVGIFSAQNDAGMGK